MNDASTTRGLQELWGEIDDAYEETQARHPGALACRAGCADCCVAGLSIGDAEAAAIARHLASLDEPERARVAALAARDEETSCVLLDDEMQCSIYAARPIVCRTFGLPVRMRDETPNRRHLPIAGAPPASSRVVDSCHKNFIGFPLERVGPRSIVDEDATAKLRAKLSPSPDRVSLADWVRRRVSVT